MNTLFNFYKQSLSKKTPLIIFEEYLHENSYKSILDQLHIFITDKKCLKKIKLITLNLLSRTYPLNSLKRKDSTKTLFKLSFSNDTYIIYYGITISANSLHSLTKELDTINTMSREDLKKYHKKVLSGEESNRSIRLIEIGCNVKLPIYYKTSFNNEKDIYLEFILLT